VRWETARPWLATVVRIGLGAIWIWASMSKLSSPRTFVQAVRAYDASPEWLSRAIGYGLPVLEFGIGVLLILGVAVRLSAIMSAVLFAVFLIGLVQAAARGLQLSCGCFGGGGNTLQTQYTLDILRDIGLLIVAVFLALWSFTYFSVESYLARHDYVEPPSAKRMRSEGGRRKYNAVLEQKRKAARERAMWLNGSIAAVVVLVSVIGIGVQSSRAKIQGSLTATNASVANGVVWGKPAAATVVLYEDFQCPNCRNLEQTLQKSLDADGRANRAQPHFYPIAILDSPSSNNNYSSRAANAALCASDVSTNFFVAYHNYLFRPSIQPAEGSGGRTNAQLITYATAAGLPKNSVSTFGACVNAQTHKALVQAMTENASKNGINSTPTVKVNGKTISNTLPAYQAAVAAALAHGPKPNPSSTPSATPSASASASVSATPSSSASSASSTAKKKK
jgi:protein-disulfide isomerase